MQGKPMLLHCDTIGGQIIKFSSFPKRGTGAYDDRKDDFGIRGGGCLTYHANLSRLDMP